MSVRLASDRSKSSWLLATYGHGLFVGIRDFGSNGFWLLVLPWIFWGQEDFRNDREP